MVRVLSILVFVALVGGILALPQADPTRLAALKAYELFDEQPADADAEADANGPTLGELVLTGPAVVRDELGPVLRLNGVRMVSDRGADLEVHALARRSLIRGLRTHAAARGESLRVDGELAPAREHAGTGADFLVTWAGDDLALTYTPPVGAEVVVVRPNYAPPERSALFPPLLAILLAILLRRPVAALFAGSWLATGLLRSAEGAGALETVGLGFVDVFTHQFRDQLYDPYRMQIVGFVFAMLSMVGIMTTSGGVRGTMQLVARLARGARSTQFATWLMGLVVFFDDYANCILVGSTMRPLTDRYRISREKLAYLVDSTAAPVAGISIFSTWIAFEVSTFSAQLPAAELLASDGYRVFVETIPFRFYCFLSLALAAMIAISGRDFGPMLAAERRARTTGKLVRDGGRPMVNEHVTSLEPAPGVVPRAHRAILPVLAFVGVTLFEIVRVGRAALLEQTPDLTWSALLTLEGITDLLGDGESTRAILIGSTTGMVLAALFAFSAGLRSEVPKAAFATLRSMWIAIAILYLAWMIGAACQAIGTADYLSEMIAGRMVPELLPCVLFLLGAMVAFSTGSSWSTMSILLPLVVGLAFSLGNQSGLGGHLLMVMSIGAVLEGSIFGDHCSPISDTTVLSSTAAASDHIDHVRTQAPYAILAMFTALVFGYLPCTFLGLNPWIALAMGVAVLVLFVRFVGRPVPASPTPQP